MDQPLASSAPPPTDRKALAKDASLAPPAQQSLRAMPGFQRPQITESISLIAIEEQPGLQEAMGTTRWRSSGPAAAPG
jgi:hypothetical protein